MGTGQASTSQVDSFIVSRTPIDCRELPVTHTSSLVGDHRQTLRAGGVRWYSRRFAKAARFFQPPQATAFVPLRYAMSALHWGWLPNSAPGLWMAEGTRLEFRSRLLSVAPQGLRVQHYLVAPDRAQPLVCAEITLVPVHPETGALLSLAPEQMVGAPQLLEPFANLGWAAPKLAIEPLPPIHPAAIDLRTLSRTACVHADPASGPIEIGADARLQDKATRFLLESLGWGGDASGLDFVCVQSHSRYYAAAPPAGDIEVRTMAVARHENQCQFVHFVIEPDRTILLASTEVFAMAVTADVHQQAELPRAMTDAFDAIASEHSGRPWRVPTVGRWLRRLAGRRG